MDVFHPLSATEIQQNKNINTGVHKISEFSIDHSKTPEINLN